MREKRAALVRVIPESRRFVRKTLTRRRRRRLAGRGWDWVEETHLQGVTGEVGPAAETEFVHDARAVGLNGLDAAAQPRADFLVGIPLGQELEHLLLTWTQELDRRSGGRCGAGCPVAEDLMSLAVAQVH